MNQTLNAYFSSLSVKTRNSCNNTHCISNTNRIVRLQVFFPSFFLFPFPFPSPPSWAGFCGLHQAMPHAKDTLGLGLCALRSNSRLFVTLKTAHSLWLDLQGPMQFLTLELYKTCGQAVTSASPQGIQPELEGICATTTKLHLREKLLLSL